MKKTLAIAAACCWRQLRAPLLPSPYNGERQSFRGGRVHTQISIRQMRLASAMPVSMVTFAWRIGAAVTCGGMAMVPGMGPVIREVVMAATATATAATTTTTTVFRTGR